MGKIGFFTKRRRKLGKAGQGNLEYLMILMVAFMVFQRVKKSVEGKMGKLEQASDDAFNSALQDQP